MHLFLSSKACIFYPKRHKITYSVRNIFTVASPRSCLCTLPFICDALVMGSELLLTLGLGLGQYSNCLKILLQEKSKKFNTSLNQVLGEEEITTKYQEETIGEHKYLRKGAYNFTDSTVTKIRNMVLLFSPIPSPIFVPARISSMKIHFWTPSTKLVSGIE